MILLHNINENRYDSNYNSIDEILALSKSMQLSFDGVYKSVMDHSYQLLDRRVILFITGYYMGVTNNFDKGASRLEYFCSWHDVELMVKHCSFELGWHTWSHSNLCDLTDEQVMKEITPPAPWQNQIKKLAYPYGSVDGRVAEIVKASGFYQEAYSVTQGDGSQFQRKRQYLNW